jgi:DMSO/TMAO reductase YedYZ molybdopterin-dependent catalytic subunit
VLVTFQLVTGAFGLAAGAENRAPLLWLHNTGAFAIAAVLFWKAAIALRSLKRPAGRRPRHATLALTALLFLTLALGISWPAAGYWTLGGTSGMTLHLLAAIALTPLVGYHAWRYTAGLRVGYDADRRAAIRLLGLGGAGVAAWLLVERAYGQLGLSAAERRFTGSHQRGSFRGNSFPTTSWLNDNPETISSDNWRLRVTGMDGRRSDLEYADLSGESGRFEVFEVEATLDCTGGWYSTQLWRGVRLRDVLEVAGAAEGGRSIEVSSITGYYRKFAPGAAADFILATHVGDEPLGHAHGAPVRLVAPGRRGFEWVKWVTSLKVSGSPHWLQPPFPLQ